MTLLEILQMHRGGALTAAETQYREYLAANHDDGDALHLLGVLRQQLGDYAEAADLIGRAIALAPEHGPFHLSLGGVLLQTGDEAAARTEFERAIELDPNLVEAHALVGHLYLRAGEVEAAENRFRVGRRADEEDPMILFGLGNVYLSRGDAANATKFLTRAAERRPNDASIQLSLGRALFDRGAFGFAEQAFANAVRMRPDLSLAHLFLARARLRQDKLDAAREGFSSLAVDNQQAFGANAGLGDVARKKDQPVRALKYYRRALQLDPTHAGALHACAWCMERMGDLAGAVHYLREGLQHAPDAVELQRPLAELLERLGHEDEARQVRDAIAAQR
jgi:tetratricopeptide (TPR) repeat protein